MNRAVGLYISRVMQRPILALIQKWTIYLDHIPGPYLTLHAGYSPMDAQATHRLAAHVRA